jgi:hypothetical protein
MRNIIEFVKN